MPVARAARPRSARAEPLEGRRLFAVAVPAGFAASTYAAGLDRPTAIAVARSGELFVAEQGGDLEVVGADGRRAAAPAVSLAVDDRGERGLLGVALDPSFAGNGHVYLYYTVPGTEASNDVDVAVPPHNRVSRFTLAGGVAAAGSERVLIDLPPLSAAQNHNGGALHFGDDGKLYVGVGDNNDPATAQPLTTALGKLLRVNPDGTVPPDNPFVAETAGVNRLIWATGLRNPYTFAFRPGDGLMHVNDVGQGRFEEIHVGAAGANFGWPIVEGPRTTEAAPAGYADPLFAYPHAGDGPVTGTAISGGAFYAPPVPAPAAPGFQSSGIGFPAPYADDYFFADFGAGWVKSIDPATKQVSDFASGLSAPVDLAVGADGAVYAVEDGAGRVTRLAAVGIDPTPDPDPSPVGSDLAVTAVDAGLGDGLSLAAHGDRGRAVVRIANAGTAAARGRVTVRILASADALADADDLVLGEATKPVRLAAGRSTAARVGFAYPAALDGTYRLVAQILPAAPVADANGANDAAAAAGPVRVAAPSPDLAAAYADARVTYVPGTRPTVALTVTNVGNVPFAGRVVADFVAYPLAAPGQVAGQGGPDVPATPARPRLRLAVGASRTIRFRLTEPAFVPQTDAPVVTLAGTVTPEVPAADADTTNNVASAPIVRVPAG